MSAVWLEQRERGSLLAMKGGVRLLLGVGHAFGRLLLYPTCAYFLASSRRARAASRDYLGRVLGRPARLMDVARHYLTFARTLHDRVYFLAGRTSEYHIEQHGLEIIENILSRGKGCVLLGAHIGSFEVLRVIGSVERKLPVNVLLYPDNASNAETVAAELCPELKSRVIPLGRPETLLRVRECLERGEIVGMLGDRSLKSDKTVRCDFLGDAASFPQGPLLLAAILGAPVVLFFGLYQGGKRYAIHFEPFAEELAIGRQDRGAELQPWIARYAERLEHYCRLAPYNWFNFYDFWRA
ncbi:MAG: acyl-CoA synthetase [Burkholderiales bacterium]